MFGFGEAFLRMGVVVLLGLFGGWIQVRETLDPSDLLLAVSRAGDVDVLAGL